MLPLMIETENSIPTADENGSMTHLEKIENSKDEECGTNEQDEEDVCSDERCIFSRPILVARKVFDSGVVVWACEVCRETKCACGSSTCQPCECLSRGGFGIKGFTEARQLSFTDVEAKKDAIRIAREEASLRSYQPEPLGYEIRFANYCQAVNANYRAISKGKKDKVKKPDTCCFRCKEKEAGLELARCSVPGCYKRYHLECANTRPCPRHACSVCDSDYKPFTCALCPIALCEYHLKGKVGGVAVDETWRIGQTGNNRVPDPIVLYIRNRVILCTDCIMLIKSCKETHALLYAPDVSVFKKIWE